jgi:hypothetical protein
LFKLRNYEKWIDESEHGIIMIETIFRNPKSIIIENSFEDVMSNIFYSNKSDYKIISNEFKKQSVKQGINMISKIRVS